MEFKEFYVANYKGGIFRIETDDEVTKLIPVDSINWVGEERSLSPAEAEALADSLTHIRNRVSKVPF